MGRSQTRQNARRALIARGELWTTVEAGQCRYALLSVDGDVRPQAESLLMPGLGCQQPVEQPAREFQLSGGEVHLSELHEGFRIVGARDEPLLERFSLLLRSLGLSLFHSRLGGQDQVGKHGHSRQLRSRECASERALEDCLQVAVEARVGVEAILDLHQAFGRVGEIGGVAGQGLRTPELHQPFGEQDRFVEKTEACGAKPLLCFVCQPQLQVANTALEEPGVKGVGRFGRRRQEAREQRKQQQQCGKGLDCGHREPEKGIWVANGEDGSRPLPVGSPRSAVERALRRTCWPGADVPGSVRVAA